MPKSPPSEKISPALQGSLDTLLSAVDALRQEFLLLQQRVKSLEEASSIPQSVVGPSPEAPPISEETISVLSAAIAAYLGHKPRLRQIRLMGSNLWAWQGRATIQASHALSRSGGHSSSKDS
jgi:methylmalonyl-CoA carboxyltransferase large subunit